MIERDLKERLQKAACQFPAITLTGPRQSGKSTLCRALFPEHPYTSLEAPDVREFAIEDPRGFLAQFPNGAVLDEVQRTPGSAGIPPRDYRRGPNARAMDPDRIPKPHPY